MDADAAAGWLDALPANEPDRDSLIRTLALALVEQGQFELATERIGEIRVESLREHWRQLILNAQADVGQNLNGEEPNP